MAFWRLKLAKADKLPKATPADNHTNSRLLQLPAEIRLQIYSYVIYPNLKRISIAHGTQKWCVTGNVLGPSIFRISHQLRAEALSYLVSKKPLQICEIETANALFEVIGSNAIGDIRSLSISQVLTKKPLPLKQVERFAHFLGQATSLRHFNLVTGLLGQKEDSEVNFDQNILLFEKVIAFVKQRSGVDFRCASGNANSQLPRCKKWENMLRQIGYQASDTDKEILRRSAPIGQMYLW